MPTPRRGARPRLADRDARRREGARGALRALSRRAALHAGPRAGQRVAGHRVAAGSGPRSSSAAARRARITGSYLPLFPAAVELLRPRRLRPRHQHQPLRGEVGHPAGRGGPRLLLPLADAVCVGPVRRLISGRQQVGRHRAGCCGRSWRGWRGGIAATAGRVDRFVANSHYVAERIRRYYNRESTVVYPPVDTTFYRPDARPRVH